MNITNAFFSGFFSVFGLCNHPYSDDLRASLQNPAEYSIFKDWQKVTKDYSRAFNKSVAQLEENAEKG